MLEVTIHDRSLTFACDAGVSTVTWDDATDQLFERASQDSKVQWLLAAADAAWDDADATWFNLMLDVLQTRLEEL